ncbi:MAG TPA: hypothetical protein VGL94_08650 [Ktedonobacteraceae bacterium]
MQAILDAQEHAVEELQQQFGLAEIDQQSGRIPNRFFHYDTTNQRRGWIVVSPKCALVVGVGVGEARTLANLIQPQDTDTSGRGEGILRECYEGVLQRIILWNATQDISETVSQLEALVESSRKSTDGQVLLNFALATIGALLAIMAFPHLNFWQICSLALIVGASIQFWLYARSGHVPWLVLGLIIIVIAVFLAIASFWYYPLLHFF